MANQCAFLSKSDISEIESTFNLVGLGKNKKEIRTEVETIFSLLLTKNPGLTVKNLIEDRKDLVNVAIADRKNEISEKQYQTKNPTVGQAQLRVSSSRVTKDIVRNNPQTLYVFSGNLQADNLEGEHKIVVDNLVEVEDTEQRKKLLNVRASSAVMRTNTAGERFPNSIGIPVKVNALINGKFTNEDENQFQDTPEHLEAFEKGIRQVCKNIKQLCESGNFTDVVFPTEFASSLARLPKALAAKMVNIL